MSDFSPLLLRPVHRETLPKTYDTSVPLCRRSSRHLTFAFVMKRKLNLDLGKKKKPLAMQQQCIWLSNFMTPDGSMFTI